MKNSRIGNEELLVAGDNKGCGEICGRMRSMLENEE